tara:strand:- start:112 stop:528 length:417 start_codon:yes stop_codon:yes gene_type:complete
VVWRPGRQLIHRLSTGYPQLNAINYTNHHQSMLFITQIERELTMPNEIITANNVNIAPLVEELTAYVKTKQVGDLNLEEMFSKLPKTNSPDWKLISGILCNSIVEWASQNANEGGKDLLQHLQSDIGYLMKRLGLTDS